MNGNWPAFPQPREDASLIDEGITVRDYFAAQAMQSLILDPWHRDKPEPYDRCGCEIASDAYKIADAMMKARGEK